MGLAINGLAAGVVNTTTNQRVLTKTISADNLIARSDYLIRISGDGTTIELKNDPGDILIPLPWQFDEKNPMLQLSARLTVDGTSEADEATSAPLDFPMTHASVPDEAVAGDTKNHPLLTFFGVRNLAAMSLVPDTPKVSFSGKTMNVFIHATARSFITGTSSATVAAVVTVLTSILNDGGFGTVGPGWQVLTGNRHSGTGSFNSTTQDCTSAGYGSYPNGSVTSYFFSFMDSHSTSHPLGNLKFTKRVNCTDPTTGQSVTGEDIPSTSGSDVDGTGYSFRVTNYQSFQVSAPDGTIVYDQGYGPYHTKYPIDTNGNYSSFGVGSQPDMLGRSPFQFQPNFFVHLCPPSSSTISVRASDGSNNTYTFTCTSYSVSAVLSGTTYTATESFLTNIALPDSTQYSFTYDTGSSGNHNGALLSVTIPAGGVVSFTYPSAGSSTVTYAGGTWTITTAFNNTTRQRTSTVMSPLRYDSVSRTNVSDKAVFTTVPNFLYLQTAQYYSGSSTLLRTVTTSYSTTGGLYLPTKITTALNDSGQSSSIYYQYYNQMRDFPSQKQETDFTGAVVRTTKTTYNPTFMKPTSVNVYAGSGTGSPIASTLYTYDEYSANYCGSVPMLTNVTGATGHDDANYGISFTARGNATTIQRLISGSTYATTHRCYDTLGNITQEVDANGKPTSYDYSDNWADTACIPSGTLTRAFPTTITDALGFRRKIKYFTCTSLAQAIADAGLTLQEVIRTRVMLTDISRWEEAARAHGEVVASVKPACTFVEVKGFINREWLVELEADCVATTGA